MAASEPPMPTGTIGHAGSGGHVGRPVEQVLDDRPDRRVPSGNMTSGSPSSITSWQVRSASRSAVPRCTGKAPSIDTNRPSAFDFQIESLPM